MPLINHIEKVQKTDYTITNIPYVRYEKTAIPWTHKRVFNENTIIYVLNGSCKAICNTNNYILKKGDILYVKKGYTYSSSENEIPFEYIMIEFEFDETIPIQYELQEYYEISNHSKFDDIFREMYRIFSTVVTASSLKLKKNMYEILILLAGESAKYKDSYRYHKIRDSVKYINENVYKKYIDIKFLADISELSLSQFNRIFKEIFLETPTKYMNRLRIERGKKLLTESTLPVNDIAKMSGFASTYYFSKMFKQETSLSPLKYRSEYFK